MILHPSTDVRINLKYPLLKTKRNNQFMPNKILNACHTIFNSRLDFCVGVKKRFGLCSWIEKNSGILSSSQGIALKCLTVIACRVSHNIIYVWIIATLSKWVSTFFLRNKVIVVPKLLCILKVWHKLKFLNTLTG